MHIFLPEIEIGEHDGFTPANDLFQRKQLAENISNIIIKCEDPLVIALDAQWGEGKTTFVKQLRGHLHNKHSIHSIYFNAFAEDHCTDPLLALGGEIYGFLQAMSEKNASTKEVWQERKEKFVKGAQKWGKLALKSGTQIALRALTAGIVSYTDFEGATDNAVDAAVDSAGDIAVVGVEKLFEAQQDNKRSLVEIRSTLESIAAEMCAEGEERKPLVFFIDELDRCRPDFALDLLESIKHVFSVPGVVFFLVFFGKQLEEHVRCRYGLGINSSNYLNKFINIKMSLGKKIPERISEHNNDVYSYVEYLFSKMCGDSKLVSGNEYHLLISIYARLKSISLREIEKIVSNIVLFHASVKKNDFKISVIIFGLCLLKVLDDELYDRVSRNQASWDEINSFFGFDSLPENILVIGSMEYFSHLWQYCIDLNNNNIPSKAEFSRLCSSCLTSREEIIPSHINVLTNLKLAYGG